MKHVLEIKSDLRGNLLTSGSGCSNKYYYFTTSRFSDLYHFIFRISSAQVILLFGILFFSGTQLMAQSKLGKSGNQQIGQKEKGSLTGLEAARIPSGITFSPELEKVYGDANYELGQEFDMNGMLIKYSAEDTTILKIERNVAMILKAGETKVFAELSEFQQSSNSVPLTQNLKVHPGTLKLSVLPRQKKVFGELDPDFEFEVSGLVYGEGQDVLSGSLSRELGENAGNYQINLGDLEAGENYKIEFLGADFEIITKELIVEAKSNEKYFGADDPELTYSAEGMNAQDLAQIISGKIKRQAGESVGKYAIEMGNLKAAPNYKLTFRESIFEIKVTQLSAIFDSEEIVTTWSIMPQFPAHISALTLDGQILNLPVSWIKNDLNLLEKGACSISGIIELPNGILNPQSLKPSQKLTVLPKPSPEDVLLSRLKFEPPASSETIEIGQFTVIDELDSTHSVSLVDGSLDNSQFQIDGLSLSWKNTPKTSIKYQYSILVSVLDRAGNRIEKEFELSTEYTQISKIHIHNVFTPNSDGFNDTWGIPAAAELGGIQIRVFNKYGELLFETEDARKQWDGTFQGKILPADTYFWVFSAKGTGETRKGFLSILL